MEVIPLPKLEEELKEHVVNFREKLIDTGPFLSLILTWEEYLKIKEIYPWIIQKEDNFSNLSTIKTTFQMSTSTVKNIYYNQYEDYPIIGVIYSGVQLPEMFEKFIKKNKTLLIPGGVNDYHHGSIVNSIIIANDEMNNSSQDGLGNFCVKHFEILNKSDNEEDVASVDYKHLINNLESIIKKHSPKIKVWNISFGARKHPWSPEISPGGMLLDYLMAKYNVLFIVASGNNGEKNQDKSLNTPADSLNSLSIGSVLLNKDKIKSNEFSSYGRTLRLLKPEVSYFGGPNNIEGDSLIACNNTGAVIGIAGLLLQHQEYQELRRD